MVELPSGTVTFLFSDVEGSTRLLVDLGEAYLGALADHRRAMRIAFDSHGGVEVDTQGDSFFVAFSRATDAVAAAADTQSALAAGPMRVRVGLHTGEPVLTDSGYVGIDVHRAARIAAAGHGGQVLLSQSTRDLVDADVRDLGMHRLKDLSAAERLYQLGKGEFPPLRTLQQTNLPVQPTRLVGRARELADVLGFLRDHTALLTLTGAGGSGKTRLALHAAAEIADEFPDGVWFVALAPLTEPWLVDATVAGVLGVPGDVAEHLRSKRLLLVLDNFEHLLAAATWVSDLLLVAPEVCVLVTSRERLGLAAEQEYSVPTLPLADAVNLFVDRARRLEPAFEADEHVSAIVQRLDGLPLALELAAARVKVLSAAQIHQRLRESLDVLSGGTRDAPDRQRTLRATVEWSLVPLSVRERAAFSRLAVFEGSFALESAEGVAAADLDTLASLVDKSLLRSLPEGRFFYLEPIRDIALEYLHASGEEDELRDREAAYLLRLLPYREGLKGAEQIAWNKLLAAEHANLRATLGWLIEHDRYGDALWLLHTTQFHWESRAVEEGYRWCVVALEGPAPSDLRGNVFRRGAQWAALTGKTDEALALATEGLTLARASGDPHALRWGLSVVGMVRGLRGEYDEGRALYEESLELSPPGDPYRTQLTHNLGELEVTAGNLERGRLLLEGSLAQARLRDDIGTQANVTHGLGDAALLADEFDTAAAYYTDAAGLARKYDSVGVLRVLPRRPRSGRGRPRSDHTDIHPLGCAPSTGDEKRSHTRPRPRPTLRALPPNAGRNSAGQRTGARRGRNMGARTRRRTLRVVPRCDPDGHNVEVANHNA